MTSTTESFLFQCGSVSNWAWQCNWLDSDRRNWYKLAVLMARAQRSDRDGLAAVGMQDTISMATFVQVTVKNYEVIGL